MNQYPEMEKLKALDAQRRAVDSFFEWLDEQGYAVCERPAMNGRYETIYMPVAQRPESLVFRFLGLDAGRLEAERRAMLDGLRARENAWAETPARAPGDDAP